MKNKNRNQVPPMLRKLLDWPLKTPTVYHKIRKTNSRTAFSKAAALRKSKIKLKAAKQSRAKSLAARLVLARRAKRVKQAERAALKAKRIDKQDKAKSKKLTAVDKQKSQRQQRAKAEQLKRKNMLLRLVKARAIAKANYEARQRAKQRLAQRSQNETGARQMPSSNQLQVVNSCWQDNRLPTLSNNIVPHGKMRVDQVQGVNMAMMRLLRQKIQAWEVRGSGDDFLTCWDKLGDHCSQLKNQYQQLLNDYDGRAESLTKRLAYLLVEVREMPDDSCFLDVALLLVLVHEFVSKYRLKKGEDYFDMSKGFKEYIEQAWTMGLGRLTKQAFTPQMAKQLAQLAALAVLP